MTEAEHVDPHEHVDPDDPRYDGFRIAEYWMATAISPDNMEAAVFVGLTEAERFHLYPGPALAADARRLVHLREYARWAAQFYNVEIRVRHFVPEGEPEIYERER
jgi:hypothetical protein